MKQGGLTEEKIRFTLASVLNPNNQKAGLESLYLPDIKNIFRRLKNN